jgi:DNA polymerase-3 subunit epsilon
MRRPAARRGIVAAILACIAAFLLIIVGAVIAWTGGQLPAHALAPFAVGATIGIAGFWVLLGLVDEHFDGLERLRSRLVMLRARPAPDSAGVPGAPDDAEAGGLYDAALALAQAWRDAAATPDARLEAIVAAVPEALVAVTDTGIVSLVNASGLAVLGADEARVGTSILAALDQAELAAARHAARASGGVVRAEFRHADGRRLMVRVVDLGPGQGALLLPETEPETGAGALHHDLSLHDVPPPAAGVSDDTPLDALPVWVLDLETTGLDPRRCRIVAVGAVRQHGGRLYRNMVIDRLVNPGEPIPPAATAVHGLTDRLVEHAPGFAAVLPELERALAGCALVGHNIGFDAAVLAAEAERCGRTWSPPPMLDTFLLAAALEPERTALDLERIAADWGVSTAARHTALGDCLITGEIFARMLPRLAERGIVTFGAARAFSLTARRALARQRAAGWMMP